jgi:hypothetical protein
MKIMASVAKAMMPSIMAVIIPSASAVLIGSMEVNRDKISPMWRFSKYAIGNRTRW